VNKGGELRKKKGGGRGKKRNRVWGGEPGKLALKSSKWWGDHKEKKNLGEREGRTGGWNLRYCLAEYSKGGQWV